MYTGPIQQETHDESRTFAHLGLDRRIVWQLHRLGYDFPTPIQGAVIPPSIEGRDVIGLAATGSGKTAAFCLPVLHRLLSQPGSRALILSPTREIAMQTKAFIDAVLPAFPDLDAVSLVGGLDIQKQIKALQRQPAVFVATPGRFLDHLERRTVRPDSIAMLVLDEADHMLDLGFLPQIRRILEDLPTERTNLLFSATMPDSIQRFSARIMREPEVVDLRPEGSLASGIEHRVYMVDEGNKKPCALSLLRHVKESTLVFIRRKIDAEWLCRVLASDGFPVEAIHADRSQSQRLAALSGFRGGEHRILVATDVAARGLDIPIVGHVIHFDLPETVEDYVHRSGRTARGSQTGIVSSIATWRDKEILRRIEQKLGCKLAESVAPGIEPLRDLMPKRLPSSRRSPLRR